MSDPLVVAVAKLRGIAPEEAVDLAIEELNADEVREALAMARPQSRNEDEL